MCPFPRATIEFLNSKLESCFEWDGKLGVTTDSIQGSLEGYNNLFKVSTCIDLVAQVVVNRLAIQWFGNRISSATCTVTTSPTTVGALLPKHLFVMLTERWGSLNKLWSLNDYGLWMVLVKSSNLSLEIHLSLLWHPVHFVLVAAIHTPAWELELSFSLILPQSHISANCSNSFHSDTHIEW